VVRAAAPAKLTAYVPEQPVTGVIRSWGSPQMGGLLRNWEAGFEEFHPDVAFADFLKGTASATYGFAENVAELGLAGRQLHTFEYYGVYRRSLMLPVEIEVATGSFDVPHKTFALAVFVHRDNPLAKLTLKQLDGIFGAQRTGRLAGHGLGEVGRARPGGKYPDVGSARASRANGPTSRSRPTARPDSTRAASATSSGA
jgi:phosphate transport system substrate-binding protein